MSLTESSDSVTLPFQAALYAGTLFIALIGYKLIRFYFKDKQEQEQANQQRVVPPSPGSPLTSGDLLSLGPSLFQGHHNWTQIDILSHSVICALCQEIIVNGLSCDHCGICADTNCAPGCTIKYSCKPIQSDKNQHHWVKGNLPLGSRCSACFNEIIDDGDLKDYRCSWCQRVVHEDKCHKYMSTQECDMGTWGNFIIPPSAIKIKLTRNWIRRREARHLFLDPSFCPDNRKPWTPLFVVANKKSGNNEANKIMRAFLLLLHSCQVIDLSSQSMDMVVHWVKSIYDVCPTATVKVMVAGGDGTVCWLLETLEKSDIKKKPDIGILPLGTGNDLSRVLGWGDVFSPDSPIQRVLQNIRSSHNVTLDRWKIQITGSTRLLSRQLFMSNYFSVGVDAFVALKFHEARSSSWYKWIGNRMINKLLYMLLGTKDFFRGRRCAKLNQRIELEMDGVLVTDLPDVEAIVLLNIPSWGAGADLWNRGLDQDRFSAKFQQSFPEQKIDDRKLEVVGLYSSLHIGGLMCGIFEPVRLGQASNVRVRLLDPLPIQVDGEPSIQMPASIDVSWTSSCSMMSLISDAESDD